jgi:hypothetical protein
MQVLYTVRIIKVVKRYVIRINYSTFKYETIELNGTLRIGEFQVTLHFLKNNGAEAPKGPRPIVFKEWRDTRTFSNLKSTHFTLLIVLIIYLVTKKSLCIVSKVQREQ